MKKFKFKLNKVLEVRQIEEDQAQNNLVEAQHKAKEIENEIYRLEEVQSDLYQRIRSVEDMSLEESMAYREYMQTNRYYIQRTEKNLKSQEKEVENFREHYLEKRKKREILEKIKEKNYKSYYKEVLHKEQKVLDELGLRAQGLKGV
ncbi:MAG: flagellar export protein FliJ [Halanaerobiales bacterium]